MRILDDKIMYEGLPKSMQERNGQSFAACITAFVEFAMGGRASMPSVHDA